MNPISNRTLATVGALFCGLALANGAAFAQAPAGAPGEEVIIRAPEIVVLPLPSAGPGVPPGLTNPEIISMSRPVSYSDLNLSRPQDVAELETRVRTMARDVCQELNGRFPRANARYVYANVDCVRQATENGLATVRQITSALGR